MNMEIQRATETAEMIKAFFWAKAAVQKEPDKEEEIMHRHIADMEQRKQTILLLNAKIKLDDLTQKSHFQVQIPAPPPIPSDSCLYYSTIELLFDELNKFLYAVHVTLCHVCVQRIAALVVPQWARDDDGKRGPWKSSTSGTNPATSTSCGSANNGRTSRPLSRNHTPLQVQHTEDLCTAKLGEYIVDLRQRVKCKRRGIGFWTLVDVHPLCLWLECIEFSVVNA